MSSHASTTSWAPDTSAARAPSRSAATRSVGDGRTTASSAASTSMAWPNRAGLSDQASRSMAERAVSRRHEAERSSPSAMAPTNPTSMPAPTS
jgi:hypothetical protein